MREKMKYYLSKKYDSVICVPIDLESEFRSRYNIRDFVKITEAIYRRLWCNPFYAFYQYPNLSEFL